MASEELLESISQYYDSRSEMWSLTDLDMDVFLQISESHYGNKWPYRNGALYYLHRIAEKKKEEGRKKEFRQSRWSQPIVVEVVREWMEKKLQRTRFKLMGRAWSRQRLSAEEIQTLDYEVMTATTEDLIHEHHELFQKIHSGSRCLGPDILRMVQTHWSPKREELSYRGYWADIYPQYRQQHRRHDPNLETSENIPESTLYY